jgi:hypothetical protein
MRFKILHNFLIRVATNKKYWGKMDEKDFNVDSRTINCGLYALRYELLDPAPKLAVSLLAFLYKYKCYQETITFTFFKT